MFLVFDIGFYLWACCLSVSLLFLGETPLRLLKGLGIDLASSELHPATQGCGSARGRAHAAIDDQAPRRDEGFEEMDRLIDALLPGVVLLAHAFALEHIPDGLGELAGP